MVRVSKSTWIEFQLEGVGETHHKAVLNAMLSFSLKEDVMYKCPPPGRGNVVSVFVWDEGNGEIAAVEDFLSQLELE